MHHLQLDGATFELDPERMVDNLQSIKEDVSSLVLLFLIVDICPLFTSNCRVYHETSKQSSSFFFFFCYKSGHIFSLTIFMSNLPRDVKFPVQKLIQTHTTSYRLLISLIIIKIKNKKHSGN